MPYNLSRSRIFPMRTQSCVTQQAAEALLMRMGRVLEKHVRLGISLAVASAGLEANEDALEHLYRAYADRDDMLSLVNTDPIFAVFIRHDEFGSGRHYCAVARCPRGIDRSGGEACKAHLRRASSPGRNQDEVGAFGSYADADRAG
jgi:hypothetical protein